MARGRRVSWSWSARSITRAALAGLVLASAAFALFRVHPYELSYYNELVGGPRGAWKRGFELTYWYDAFNDPMIDDLNRLLPLHARVDFLNEHTKDSVIVFQDRQNLGSLRRDIILGGDSTKFPYVWLLTHDSKATAFTRLLFAMRPWYASEPRQLDGARVATVNDPVAVSRLGTFCVTQRTRATAPRAQERLNLPPVQGPIKAPRFVPNPVIMEWSRSDPDGLLAAARRIAAKQSIEGDEPAQRLFTLMTIEANPKGIQQRHGLTDLLLAARPEALIEAVQMLNSHRDEIVDVVTRYGYIDPHRIGGYLDRDFAATDSERRN